jgi:hypothetical protein
MTIEILELVQFDPNEKEPEKVVEDEPIDLVGETVRMYGLDEIGKDVKVRNKRIMEMFNDGISRDNISKLIGIRYETVCKVIKKVTGKTFATP